MNDTPFAVPYAMHVSMHGGRMKTPEVMTSEQAAEFLGLSESQVNRLAAAGTIATYLKANGLRGARFFHRDEVTRVAVERELAS